MPTKLKIRDRDLPVAGEVYKFCARLDPPREFTDARTGIRCQSRENLSVRLYPHELPDARPWGELRFFTCSLDSEPVFSSAPVWLQKVDGVRVRGVWWIAAPGVDYRASAEAQQDVVLFAGSVLVQLGQLPERRLSGSFAMEIANRTTVYDRREDRMSSVARAEWIRRTVNNRSYEFINLRDIAVGEVVEAGGPERILTPTGLEEVTE